MILKGRQRDILLKIVEEYIRRAQPISSKFLQEKYKFPLSPATLRAEMYELTKKGFLFQPHISAGRIPTDKGYRTFVDKLISEGIKELKIEEWMVQNFENEIIFFQFLVKKLAELSKALISVYIKKERLYFEAGWQEVVNEPEFKNKDVLFQFTGFSKKIESIVKNWKIGPEIKIYIGKEIPIQKGKQFTLILLELNFSSAGKIIFSLCGPQRMDYNRNIGLFEGIKKHLKSL